MKWIVPGMGWLLWIYMIVMHISGYGTRWEFGRYYTAKPLLAPDGKHYLDGSEVNEFELRLIEIGKHEELQLILWGFFLIGLCVCAVLALQCVLKRRRFAAWLKSEHGLSEDEAQEYIDLHIEERRQAKKGGWL